MSGNLALKVFSWAQVTNIGTVTGTLTQACSRHHDRWRKWGRKDLPQHDRFIVYAGKAKIGEMAATGTWAEYRFVITDRKLFQRFRKKTLALREAARRRWR